MFSLFLAAVSCVPCHAEIAAQYRRTPMANTSGPVRRLEEPVGVFHHAPSNTRYEVVRGAEALELRFAGRRIALEFFVGSGRMGRSYAWVEDGFLYQAPAGYYSNRRAWDAPPGYENDRAPDLDRPIGADCLFCHASAARIAPGTLNRVENREELAGVACDRCHGDGAAHAAKPSRENIVNPARLPRSLRDAVCEQCHLAGEVRILLPGRRLGDFRPSVDLSEFLGVYVAREAAPGVKVNSHAEALARSRCRGAGAKLWCGTCHNPHRPAASFREKCLGCHETEQCTSPRRASQDCMACHMPKARAWDGGHTVFTDHSIPRRPARPGGRPGAPADIVPYYRRELPRWLAARNLGLAYCELAARYRDSALYEKAWPLLREAVQAGPGDAALYGQVAQLFEATGRVAEAIDFYRRSLNFDPDQPPMLVGLARLLANRGEKQEARTLYQRALRMNPRLKAER